MNDRLYKTLHVSLLVLLLILLGPLLLLGTFASITGYQSTQPGDLAGLVLSLALAIFVSVDIFLTVAIVRAIVRHVRSPQTSLTAEPHPAAAAQSIRMLAVAIAAQIFFGALNSIFALAHSQATFQSLPHNFAAWSYLLVSFVPAHLPFLLPERLPAAPSWCIGVSEIRAADAPTEVLKAAPVAPIPSEAGEPGQVADHDGMMGLLFASTSMR